MENLRIVVAGHIDHGKSTLIGRLLYETNCLPQNVIENIEKSEALGCKERFAFVTDQLEEEQAGGITIDTTQVEFKTAKRSYTLIDTPGHKEFLKNMVTGTTRADAAILLIDASQGPLVQTYQHAYLIAMLGIRQILVVINKMDIKLYSKPVFRERSEEITDFLKKLNMEIIAIVPVSAQHGENITEKSYKMQWNKSPTLMKSLDYFSSLKNPPQLPLRLIVQCPYVTNGETTILGKVTSGKLLKNHQLTFGPTHFTAKVLAIEVSGQERATAESGESVAIVLENTTNIERGQVGFDIRHPPLITDYLTADVFWIGTEPLRTGRKIDFLCGTRRCSAQVENISKIISPVNLEVICTDADELQDSQVASVKIKLDSPVCVDPFDKLPELGRFAIVQNGRITGGGVVK
ncbi:MAG: GTP-binding protein [Planctomycetes bacterium]|nr:GTP-binding protein [Planctomycetota bacterium]